MIDTVKKYFLNFTNNTIFDNILKIEEISCNFNICLASIGIIGNLLSLYAFSRDNLLKRQFNWYLLVIVSFELVYCVIVFSDNFFSKFQSEPIYLHNINKMSYIIIDFIVQTIDLLTVTLMIILSLDRIYAIKNPVKAKNMYTNVHAKKVIIASLLATILLKTTSVLLFEQNDICNENDFIYCSFVAPFLLTMISLIIIFILNGIMVKNIISFYRNRPKTSIIMVARKSLATIVNFKETRKIAFTSQISENNQQISETLKSLYFITMAYSSWLIITSIPYICIKIYFVLVRFNKISNNFDLKTIFLIQMITAIIFNSNHCAIFFISFKFYNDFRTSILNIFLKLFHVKN